MLKKTITYTDYNDEEVTEDFYFNFTKLELLEQDLAAGGLQPVIEELNKTQDTTRAYNLFKKIILAAYGQKSEDGKRFIKSEEITKEFESSPAMSEMILEFLQDPRSGAQFIEATLPAKLVAEVKAASESSPTSTPELAAAPPVLEEKGQPEKEFSDFSKEELLAMPQAQFQKLIPKNPKDMSQDQLLIAFERKSKQ